MWLLLLLITFWSILAFITNHQRQALLIITFLATGGFQLLPIHWFWSPLLLVKPYDYAYAAMAAIFLLRGGELGKILVRESVARLAAIYMGFLLFALVVSVVIFSYSIKQSFQSARVFFWPAFLLLFLLVDRTVLVRFVRLLYPIVFFLSVLYLLQPITGKTIINPSGEYFNPYLGSTDFKRYLSTPVFLIFFLLLAYHSLCTYLGNTFGPRIAQLITFLLFISVQLISFTRSAIIGTAFSILYLSMRLVNSVLLVLFLIAVAIAGAVAYSANSHVEERIDAGLKDIKSTVQGEYEDYRPGKDGTLSFRIAHINERFMYVVDDIARWPMGVGFIHEDSAAAQNLGFKIGLRYILTGRVVQVDTGDIVWSVVIIKTGIVGLLLLLAFLIHSFISVGSSRDIFAVVYRGGLIYFFVTSFFSNNFVNPNTALPLMLFLAVALRSKHVSEPAAHKPSATVSQATLTQELVTNKQGRI